MLTIENNQDGSSEYLITIQAHYSGSKYQTILVIGALGVWFFLIFLWCINIGAWPIIMFCFLAIMTITLSFQYCLNQASDYEKLMLGQTEFVWLSYKDGHTRKKTFNPGWLRVHAHYAVNGDCEKITLHAHNKVYTVAKQVTYEEREALYTFLKSKVGFAFQ